MSFTLNLVIEESLIRLNPRDFVRDVIVGQLGAKIVVVGEGFRFGFEQSGDVSTLLDLGLELGFTVQVVPYLKHGGEIVSTSRVRSLLAAGDVREASKLLGRFHSSLGVIEHGLKIGREIGFPTANMSRSAEGLLPLDGVYAGWLISEGHKYMAALSVGTNETFEAVPRILEAHVIDRKDLDLYDKVVQMEFVEFIRGAVKFDGVEELVIEINRDLEKIRVVLS
jgi:riboflavin kinase/FMN adenylyltransferase